jgi:hypothetical protein
VLEEVADGGVPVRPEYNASRGEIPPSRSRVIAVVVASTVRKRFR